MPPVIIMDPAEIDCSAVIIDTAGIEAVNPHRHGMRMLDGIVHVDLEQRTIAGYKDCRHDEFWVPGHMPGFPILPGVLMCEAAAQLASFYTKKYGILGPELLGLGAMNDARFRAPVRPGDRLLVIGKGIRVDRRRTEFYVTGFVGSTLAFNVNVVGVPIPGHEKVSVWRPSCAGAAAV
jgi:3-hydroxyacyl-[acyl-carrier-protein] dehydratase